MYRTVQNLKKNGVPPAEIVRQIGLDWKTVQKYLSMTPEEYHQYRIRCQERPLAFEFLREDILACYSRAGNRKLHVSSVFDFLEEKHGALPGSERTLRNFIKFLQGSDALDLERASRRYRMSRSFLRVSNCSSISDRRPCGLV